eukprot:CAMPEP_0114613180 /NCGR_PEP_ID=MMETSP0168-20121206/4999_1 /TAXON_ID=95228 ORGANISM="Vannella sp., Strain DIVA3 517/6/12" /NCGR_SAMPLE_ID=MMETSP0168 /ASSEMBLY_ACC=CAM_ASM_000044 /LENGTH=484 /DNA_ID=CAMNT_0001824177 /DNA_START=31 /DNA_END=1485 /DNA_ORIENTATION=+
MAETKAEATVPLEEKEEATVPVEEAAAPAEAAPATEEAGSAGGDDDAAAKKKRKRKKKKKKKKAANPLVAAVTDVESEVPLELDENMVRILQKAAGKFAKEEYAFWKDEPVPQSFGDTEVKNEPIEPALSPEEVPKEPEKLHSALVWCEVDIRDPAQLDEVYTLLYENYVEDEDEMFRFDYSRELLTWALTPPGAKPQWYVGIRGKEKGKLLAFITAIPANLRVYNKLVPLVEINFLCVHKKLRSKSLAPTLIKEITRRVHVENLWQAVFTAGKLLPRPVTISTYYHRSLNPKKLVDVGFSHLHSRMTMARMIKLNQLPKKPATPGFRIMVQADVPQVTALLQEYLQKFKLAPHFTEDEVSHWLLPRKDILKSYVVERDGKVLDFVSFYTLPSTVMKHKDYDTLYVAYSYYNVAKTTPWVDLMRDALISAKELGFDVFNCLDIMDNKQFLKELNFGVGDGQLNYYLYNWHCPSFQSEEMGLVLM